MPQEWTPPPGHPLTFERAKELVRGELGDFYRRLLSGSCAPVYWHERGTVLDSGTVTFAHTPERLFAITAAHVVRGYERALADAKWPLQLQLMDAAFNMETIDIDDKLDLATLVVDKALLSRLGKDVEPLRSWAPSAAQEGRGILLAGYPGGDRLAIGKRAISWGLFTAIGTARRVFGDKMTWAADRSADVQTDLPPGHRLGGISGGPLIGLFEGPGGLVRHALSGIIIEAHQELENVVARRAEFIRDDGTLIKPYR